MMLQEQARNLQGNNVSSSSSSSSNKAIVNISSISALMALPKFLPYSTAKAAVDELTRCCALDLGQHNIRYVRTSILPQTPALCRFQPVHWSLPLFVITWSCAHRCGQTSADITMCTASSRLQTHSTHSPRAGFDTAYAHDHSHCVHSLLCSHCSLMVQCQCSAARTCSDQWFQGVCRQAGSSKP